MLHYFPVNPRNKRPLVKGWQQYNGEPVGTYGIALSSEYLIVDTDPRNGGATTEEEMLLLDLLPPTKIVTTASGGKHYYYKKPANLKTHKKLEQFKGVDFLSKGSYVIGENSLIKGVPYLSNGAEIADISLDLLNEISYEKIVLPNLDTDYVELATDEIIIILGYLPPNYYNNYDLWTKIGMCIHHATKGSQKGLDIWDEWSKNSTKYRIGLCSEKWRTFSRDKPQEVTVATLISYAFQHGYVPLTDAQPTNLGTLERPVKKSIYDILAELSDWVYVTAQRKFFNVVDKRIFDIDTMRLHYRRVLPKGDPISLILQSKQLTIVDNFSYAAGQPLFTEDPITGITSLNKWLDPKIEATSGDASTFENHLRWLLEDDWQIMRDWMAWIIQNPNERNNWAILISGAQGIGKSYMGETLRQLLGLSNVSYPSNEGIHEKYTDWAAYKQLVIINELMNIGRRDLVNKLKQLLTEEYIPVREMRSSEYTIKATFNLLISSNYDNPIVLDADDRRFCILKSFQAKRDKTYYRHLWSWTENNIGVIKFYLLNVDLSNYDHRDPPMTFAKQILIGESNYSGNTEIFNSWVLKNRRTIFFLSEVSNFLCKESENFEYFDLKKVANVVRYKFQFLKRIRVKGTIERVYVEYSRVSNLKTKPNNYLINLLEKERNSSNETNICV